MSKLRKVAPFLLASAIFVHAAHAQTSAEDRAAADAAYAEGVQLLKQKRFAEACPKLEASQKLDPGIGTLLSLGYCFENDRGRTASAWAAYNDAEALARRTNDRRAQEAAKQAKRVEPTLSRLVLDVAAENRGAAIEIRRDGRVVDAALWSSAVPLDPGSHTLEASKPGKQAWRMSVEIEAKPGVTTVRVPALADAPAAAEPAGAAETKPAPFWSGRRTAGIVVGSVGLAGTVLGAVLGGLTLSKAGDAKAHCKPLGGATACDPMGLALRSDARPLADVATTALAIGGVAVAAGVVLLVTAPSGKAPPSSALWVQGGAVVGAGSAGLSIEGVW